MGTPWWASAGVRCADGRAEAKGGLRNKGLRETHVFSFFFGGRREREEMKDGDGGCYV